MSAGRHLRSYSGWQWLCCKNPVRDSSRDASVIDSTGIEVEGGGEWNVRKHGGTTRVRYYRSGVPADAVARRGAIGSSPTGDGPSTAGDVATWLTRRKIHIGIDGKTPEIRAVELTTSGLGDAPMRPERRDQLPPDRKIGSVTADGAFDTRKCHDALAARGATAIVSGAPPVWG